MYSLQRFLVDYSMAMLRALAQNRGVRLSTNHQPEAADQLAVALLDPLSVRTALARLSPQGREALESLLAAGGAMRGTQFDRRFGRPRPIGPGRLEREAPWQDPANPAEELWYAAFVFRAFHEDQAGPGEFVFVPEDLLPLLPGAQAQAYPFAVESVVSPPEGPGDESTLIRDLFFYLVYLQNHDVHPYADGRLGQRDLAAVRARLPGVSERRFAFARHLAERLGFVIRQGDFLRLEAATVKRWLTASPAQQLAVVQQAWRDDPTWKDLCHVPSLICDRETSWQLSYDPVAARRALLSLLARCPVDGWWSLDSFVAAVKQTQPDFQRPDGDYVRWYIRDAVSGAYLSGFESWDLVEGRLVADLLAGPLRWLGVVALAQDGEAAICRLTAAGARFLDLVTAEPQAPSSPPIVVHPDFRIEIPQPLNLYTQFQLERFADPVSSEPCVYTLTVGSLTRGLARGIQVEQVVAFLRQASDGRLPANVAGQLQLWGGRFGQAQLEEIAILRVKSERVLRELSVLPEIRPFIARVLSPTTALVRKDHLPRLRKELRALGFFPPEEAAGDSPKRG